MRGLQLDLLLALKPPWQEHKPAVKTYHYESNINMKTAIIASLVAGAAAFAPAANKVSDRENLGIVWTVLKAYI